MKGIDEEVIILKAVNELIYQLVNFELMSLYGNDPESSIKFESITHQRFFNIVLVDFLSVTDRRGPIKQTSYLKALHGISDNPRFNVDGSISDLRHAAKEFKEWLDQVVEVDIWLPTIEKQTTIRINRFCFLKMTGNISKHNYLRAVGVAEELKEILTKSGISVDTEDALLALADFYEKFHIDVLNYHSSTIAEFLNNIRWGIYLYLQPEFLRSIVWDNRNPLLYRYTYPKGISSKFAKTCYWDLMNDVRQEPCMRKFRVTRWLKLRY